MANNIMVERETFESNGKTYFGYFIKGVNHGSRQRYSHPNRPAQQRYRQRRLQRS